MKQFILLGVFLSLSIFSSAQLNTELYVELDTAINTGKYEKAELILVKLAKIESDNFLFSLKKAQFFNIKNKLDSAALYVEKAIDQYKYLPMSHNSDQFQIRKDSLYRSSILIYDQIISINPKDGHYCNRGILKKDIGLYKESIVDFSKAIEIDSSDYMNYYNRGLAYEKLNLLDYAISDYTKCILLNPDYSSGYLNKGFALIYKNKYQEAIEEFDLALSKPIGLKEKGYVINNIGFAYYKLEDFASAKKHIKRSLEIYPLNSFAYKNIALTNIATNNIDEACKNIQRSIELGFVNQFGNEILELQKVHCKNSR